MPKINPIATSAIVAMLIAACASPNLKPATAISTVAPANESQVAEVWLTLPDESRKLARQADVQFEAGPGAGEQTILINDSIAYQPIEGVGAAMTDSSAWLIMNKLNEEQRAILLSNLFTREGEGIGLNYLRLPMGASDFALQNYTYDDMTGGGQDNDLSNFSIQRDEQHIIPALKLAKALNPQLRLMGSPWSPPAWMKTGNQIEGGSLRPEYFEAFARYHVLFAQAYLAAGLPIDILTPQNEPMHQTDSYPTMAMSPLDQQTFVRDHLGPALAQAGLDTRVLILDHNWDLADYALKVLEDPQAAQYIAGTAFHCYGGDVAAQSAVFAAHPDKEIWFTECSGGDWATDFGDNVGWNMRHLVVGNFRNWGRGLLLWNLALDENDGPQNGGCDNCRGVVTINQGTGVVTYNEEYYILGHVSKFVDLGAYRIDSTTTPLDNVAFLNPDGSLVLIVHTPTAAAFDVVWNGQHFSYDLPIGGTVTFKWMGSRLPVATVTPGPTHTPRPTNTPRSTIVPGAVLNPVVAQNFESEDTYYSVYQVETSLGDVAHSGATALKSHSIGGEWHTAGAYLDPPSFDAGGYGQVCFWIYDTTAVNGGQANNTVGVRLFDASGMNEEKWTDYAGAGDNPKTTKNEWTQMCLNLSAYTLIDLSQLEKIEFAMYWAGDYYFDEITFEPAD